MGGSPTLVPQASPTDNPIESDFIQNQSSKNQSADAIAQLNAMDENTRNQKLASVGWTPDDFKPYLSDANKQQGQATDTHKFEVPEPDVLTPLLNFAKQVLPAAPFEKSPTGGVELNKEYTWSEGHPIIQGLKMAGLAFPVEDVVSTAGSMAMEKAVDLIAPNHPYIKAGASLIGGLGSLVASKKLDLDSIEGALKTFIGGTAEGTPENLATGVSDAAMAKVTSGTEGAPAIASAAQQLGTKAAPISVMDTKMAALNEQFPMGDDQAAMKDILSRPSNNRIQLAKLNDIQDRKAESSIQLANEWLKSAKAGDTESMAAVEKVFDEHFNTLVDAISAHEAAGSETGGALQILKSQSELAQNVKNAILQSEGGSRAYLMKQLATVDNNIGASSTEKVKSFLSSMMWGDAPHAAIMDAQLLNPRIMAEKGLTDTVNEPFMAIMRSVGEGIKTGNVPAAARMVMGQTRAMYNSLLDGWQFAKRTAMTGEPEFDKTLGIGPSHTYAEDFNGTTMGAASGMMESASRVASYIYQSGRRGVMALDQWNDAIGHRTAQYSYAFDRGMQDALEKGFSGARQAAYAASKAEEYINENPRWLQQASIQEMQRTSFKDDDWLTSGASAITNWVPFGKVIAPWIRTPINLIEQGMLNSPAAPLTPKFWQAMNSGDDLLKYTTQARMALGSAGFGSAVMGAMDGRLTGDLPSKPDVAAMWRQIGIPERSIKIGDKWHSYAHIPVVSQLLSLAANFAQYGSEMPDTTADSYGNLAIKLMGNMITHSPFTEPFFQLIDTMRSAQRYGASSSVRKYLGEKTSQVIPEPLSEWAKVQTPYLKEIQGFNDVWKSKLPYFAKDVAPYRDWQGNLQYIAPGNKGSDIAPHWYDTLIHDWSPIPFDYVKQLDNVDKEILRNRSRLNRIPVAIAGPNMMDDPTNPKGGIPIDGKIQDEWAQLAGKDIKIGGMNQHDFMENKINSVAYQNIDKDHPDPEIARVFKNIYIEGVHKAFVGKAMDQVLHNHKDLMNDVIYQKRTQMQKGFTPNVGVE